MWFLKIGLRFGLILSFNKMFFVIKCLIIRHFEWQIIMYLKALIFFTYCMYCTFHVQVHYFYMPCLTSRLDSPKPFSPSVNGQGPEYDLSLVQTLVPHKYINIASLFSTLLRISPSVPPFSWCHSVLISFLNLDFFFTAPTLCCFIPERIPAPARCTVWLPLQCSQAGRQILCSASQTKG